MPTLDSYFQITARKSTVSRELRGAVATFLTMAYILAANPNILAAAGIDKSSAIACTALASAVCCILMGLYANFPLATAPGMGLNAFVAFVLVKTAGSWQAAMGVIVLDGVIMLLLVQAGLREAVLNAIPRDLRLATGAGIGLFIAFLGLVNAHFVEIHLPEAPLQPGLMNTHTAVIALIGLIVMACLIVRKIPGAILIGIAAATVAAMLLGEVSRPPAFAWPRFGNAFHANVRGALDWKLLPALFAVLMVDFFDTLGTATAIAEQAGLVGGDGKVSRIKQVLIVDSLAAVVGGMLGASSVTAYIESAAGVAEGARTGLHTVFVGLMFFTAILLAPLAALVPPAATAPALILVGFLIMQQVTRIDFTKFNTAIPAFVTLVSIPLSYSIAHGIGYGFVVFVAIQILTGQFRSVKPLMYAVAAAFAIYFTLERR